MKKLYLILILICLTNITGCVQKNADDVENNENPYFFKQGTSEQIYSCAYDSEHSDYFISTTIDVILYVNKLFEIEDGTLYQLKMDTVFYYDESRMILGYFFVQKDKIYIIVTDDFDINEFKTKDDIISNSDVVCQDEEIKDPMGEEYKGWHNFMLVDGDKREYHRYSNAVETGYYEHFIWEYGKGLVSYVSGWGAESRPIELQISEQHGGKQFTFEEMQTLGVNDMLKAGTLIIKKSFVIITYNKTENLPTNGLY